MIRLSPQQWMIQQYRQLGRSICLILDSTDQHATRQALLASQGAAYCCSLYIGTPAADLADAGPFVFLMDSPEDRRLDELLNSPECNWGWLASVSPETGFAELVTHWRERLIVGTRPHYSRRSLQAGLRGSSVRASGCTAMRALVGCSVIGSLLGIAGCTSDSPESFTFTADLPPDFSYSAIARYGPAKGETCSVRAEDRPDLGFNRKWRREYKSESRIPVFRRVKGCRLSLYKIDLYINGVYGNDYGDFGRDSTSVFISDQFEQKYLGTFDITGKSILEGQCQWLFRTQGPNRRLSKGVICKKIDAQGNVTERRPVGAYTLDALPGKTILLKITLANEEKPGWGDTWVKFPNGWKRCLGEGIQDQRGYCRGNYKDFSSFKMPDGRDCSIYPTCTE